MKLRNIIHDREGALILRNLLQALGPDSHIVIREFKLFDFIPLGSHVDADGHILRGFSHGEAGAEATFPGTVVDGISLSGST